MKALIGLLLGGLIIVAIGALFLLQKAPTKINPTPAPSTVTSPSPTDQVVSVKQTSDEIVLALKNRDMAKVAAMSDKEVRFSPYVYVDVKNHKTLPQEVIKNLFIISAAYTWGNYDGSGEPIILGPGPYYEKFIYDKDYANAKEVFVNDLQKRGNIINNISSVYPNSEYVEYYIPPTQEGGMDWSSLILVLKKINGEWKLQGLVHDQWTI